MHKVIFNWRSIMDPLPHRYTAEHLNELLQREWFLSLQLDFEMRRTITPLLFALYVAEKNGTYLNKSDAQRILRANDVRTSLRYVDKLCDLGLIIVQYGTKKDRRIHLLQVTDTLKELVQNELACL